MSSWQSVKNNQNNKHNLYSVTMNRILFLNFIRISRHFRSISSTVSNCFEQTDYLTSELKAKILYSSYLEDQKLKLGYRKNRALEQTLRKYEKSTLLNRVDVKPFPQALKALLPSIDIEYKRTELQNDTEHPERIQYIESKPHETDNWMSDYEFYDSDDEENGSNSGTPDPSIPPSKVPCSGCGAVLHCADTGLPGYIPSEIFRGRTQKELQRIICQRCHFLKNYNIALDVAIAPVDYVKTLKSIQEKHALAVLIVDLLDFPCSIWPGIQEILGRKRPIFIVGNKVDLLPRDSSGYLSRIKDSLTKAIVNAGIHQMNIKHVALISAKTGYGIENLITQLHHTWKYEGDVYLVGCTNVGKSTLFNALLKSDYCKSQAFDLIQKATTCPWPGTTLQMLKFPILRPSDVRLYYRQKRLLSERAQQQAEEELQKEQMRSTGKPKKAQTLIGHIGQTFVEDQDSLDPFSMSKGTSPILTLNEKDRAYVNSRWCYDTPGVVHPDQVLDLLTTEEIIQVLPKNVIQPQPFILKPGMSLHLAGLARLCFLEGNCNYIRIHVFASSELPILITTTDDADEVYSTLRGSEFLSVPLKDEIRQRKWPGLESSDPLTIVGVADRGATCDIVLSSIGWIGLELPSRASCTFRAWTPQKRGIHIRSPPLISQTSNLRGSKIRGSLAYRKKVSSF